MQGNNLSISLELNDSLLASMGVAGRYLVKLAQLRTYEDFVDLVHDVIDDSIRYMQAAPQHHQDRREEALTNSLLQHFAPLGIDATAETDHGGHCDITIRHRLRGWTWLGESKKHSDYDHLQGGLNQLLYRYGCADDGQDKGGMVIFIFVQRASQVITRWREVILTREDCSTVAQPQIRPNMSFISYHPETERTGLPYTVKHIGISLYYRSDDNRYIS